MSRHFHRTSAAFLSIAAFAACASGGSSSPSTAASPSPMPQQAAGAAIPLSMIQWTGSFRSAAQVTGDVGGGYTSVSGGVRLTANSTNSMHAHITLSTNAGMSDATNLHWAVAAGDCHDGALPVAPITAFPDITVSRDRGELDGDVATPMITSGRYHANIFWRESTDEADVMTCAPLQMSKIK